MQTVRKPNQELTELQNLRKLHAQQRGASDEYKKNEASYLGQFKKFVKHLLKFVENHDNQINDHEKRLQDLENKLKLNQS